MGLEIIKEINELWEPVYPHLARHIKELYPLREGNILDIGPFSGVIFSLMKEGVGDRFAIASFPSGMGDFFLEKAEKAGVKDKIDFHDKARGNLSSEHGEPGTRLRVREAGYPLAGGALPQEGATGYPLAGVPSIDTRRNSWSSSIFRFSNQRKG